MTEVQSSSVQKTPSGREQSIPADDLVLIEKLRNGDDAAFASLIEQYHMPMCRVARMYVADAGVAEEIAQEAWVGFLQSLRRFEQRCSLRTWLFRILVNCAKTRSWREGRSISFSSLENDEDTDDGPTVDPERFRSPGEPYAGGWRTFPRRWGENPEERLLSQEVRSLIDRAIAELPPRQRVVITLRDIEGWTTSEVGELLSITEGNQRVLLHRARAHVRRVLECYLEVEG